MEIFQAEEESYEDDELDLLLIKDYEDKHIELSEVDPIDVVKLKMQEKGMKAKDVEPLPGSKGHVSSILSGRRELTLNTARYLRDLFKLPAEIFMASATKTKDKKGYGG
jgi:HTH-type transcriptional regulator/antitoxin HigA